MSDDLSSPENADLQYDDIDDVIEIAARKKRAAAERLQLEDLRDVAGDLGIDDEFVEEAVVELERRRERKARQNERRREQIRMALVGAAVFLVVLAGFAMLSRHQLGSDLNDVRQQRVQVANAIDRQHETQEYWADREHSSGRDAELQGAVNRVSVETRRYDESASRYNRRADGVFTSMWTGIFGFPDEVPLSDEIDEW